MKKEAWVALILFCVALAGMVIPFGWYYLGAKKSALPPAAPGTLQVAVTPENVQPPPKPAKPKPEPVAKGDPQEENLPDPKGEEKPPPEKKSEPLNPDLLLLIAQFDSADGGRGQVFEIGRDKKTRWMVPGVSNPMDAQLLPGNRVLVAEHALRRVIERDLTTGKVLWEYRTVPDASNCIACERLANGNTFIASYHQIVEITPDKKEVYRINVGFDMHIFGAQKMRDGNVAFVTNMGNLHVHDPVAEREELRLPIGKPVEWCGVESLPEGRFLIALAAEGEVREIDSEGKIHWAASFPGAFRATRLPNGNTLVASQTTRQVVELDATGQPIWETTLRGRPWMVRPR